MSSIRATVTASSTETRILVRDQAGDLLIARLGPLAHAQRLALRCLLEAVALWEQQTVVVVLYADDGSDWSRTGLVDALDIARETVLLKVELVPFHTRRHRAKRLSGLGSFERARRCLRAISS